MPQLSRARTSSGWWSEGSGETYFVPRMSHTFAHDFTIDREGRTHTLSTWSPHVTPIVGERYAQPGLAVFWCWRESERACS